MEASITSNARTPNQEKQVSRMLDDLCQNAKTLAIKRVNPGKDGTQRLIGKGTEIGAELNEFMIGLLQKHAASNQFADEEVESKYGYLSGYNKPTGLTEQCNQLREIFPGVGYANQDLLTRIEEGEVELSEGAEGRFAIPSWMKHPQIFGETYCQAVQTVLNGIKKDRKGRFYNYREGQIIERHLRQSARSERFWKELAEAQGNPDILIVDAQFGIRHRGRSVRRALEVMNSREFGLGAFAVGIMLLTHPERLKNYGDLWIDCAGDAFFNSVGSGGAPYFYFDDGKVLFVTHDVDYAYEDYGSVSGFLPQ
jgi:hypothetical protein